MGSSSSSRGLSTSDKGVTSSHPTSSTHRTRQRKRPSSGDTAAVKSKGQLARRQSFVTATDTSRFAPTAAETPLVGGLTFLDVVFIAIAYGINLIKTLGIAELVDIGLKAFIYCVSKLPCDFYQRSRPASAHHVLSKWFTAHTPSSRDKEGSQPAQTVLRSEPISASPAQLSSFHHLVILLTRFACANFPHLLPRVLFAEETMLPFVGWRTGGASWGLMQEINIQGSYAFKGVWFGADAFARNNHKSDYRSHAGATTILYLHGGGFSLGSVAFYAEALLRVLNKVAQIESSSGARGKKPARCLAVEYDLSPSCRFPDPLLQCLRSYAYLLEKEELNPEDIVFAGDSAGANLAMSMLLVLNGQARSDKTLAERDWSLLPLPHKALLISPWVDLRPRKAQAFASLRRSDIGAEAKTPSAKVPASETGQSRNQTDLSDSITAYDWDYVTAETLLHFAQVYAGILPQPRRVAGPIGWFAHLCGVLSQGLKEEASLGSSKVHPTKQRSLDPARRLAKAVYAALEEPIFEKLSAPETSSSAHKVPSFTAGLQPIFPRSERKTQKVASTGDLYEPFDDRTGGDGAQRLLDESALLSPAAGDWSQIQLQGGALVTWGARERLASDIEQWVQDVQSGKPPSDLDKDVSSDDGPSQDGQREKEHSERRERGAWLKTAIEDGPGGVHAWPFVSMYLAGTEYERERGIELLARFVARPQGAKHHLQAPRLETRAVKDQNVSQRMQEQESDREEAGSVLSSPNIARAAIGREFTEEEFMEAIGLGPVSGSDFGSSIPTSLDSSSESRGHFQPRSKADALLSSEEDLGSTTTRSLDYASAQQKAHTSHYPAQSSYPKRTMETSTSTQQEDEDYARLLAKDAYHRLNAKDSNENETGRGARAGDPRAMVSNDTDIAGQSSSDSSWTPNRSEGLLPSSFGICFASRQSDDEGLSDIVEEDSASPVSTGFRSPQEDDAETTHDEPSPDTRQSLIQEAELQLAQEESGIGNNQSTADSSRKRRDAWWAS